jgi:hypothetical protein
MTFFVGPEYNYMSLWRPANLSTELTELQQTEKRAREGCPMLFSIH